MAENLEYKHVSGKKMEEKRKVLSNPIKHIDLEKISTIADLIDAFKGSSIQSRSIARCAQVYENMITDPDRPLILMGITGALIAGGLRKVIRDMIANGIVDGIVSTGAIMYQDIYQAMGYRHYIGTPFADDAKLRELWIDRIYDTYVDEDKFWEVDTRIGYETTEMEPGVYSTREYLAHMAKLAVNDENSILGTAKKNGVPVFAPALADSSIGIGLTKYYHLHKLVQEGYKENPFEKGAPMPLHLKGKGRVVLDTIKDNYELTSLISTAKATGAIYIGGGVPKNYINDSEVMAEILGAPVEGHRYAFQITTDAPHWGGLSGSTLEEAQSWGKVSLEATKATAYVEATIGLPLVVGYILQKGIHRKRKRWKISWKGDTAQLE